MGAFCLTKVLLPLLEDSPIPSRVVNVTSFTHWSGNISPATNLLITIYRIFHLKFLYRCVLWFLSLHHYLCFPSSVCCRQADRETVSGKCFMKSRCYPYAHIYEYSKCKHVISEKSGLFSPNTLLKCNLTIDSMPATIFIWASPTSRRSRQISSSLCCVSVSSAWKYSKRKLFILFFPSSASLFWFV